MRKFDNVKFEKNNEGEEEVIVLPRINLGKLQKQDDSEKTKPDGTKYHTIIMKCYVKSMMGMYKDIIIQKAKSKKFDMKEFDEVLQEYCQFYMMDSIGVEHYPIIENEKGELEGFKEDFFKLVDEE